MSEIPLRATYNLRAVARHPTLRIDAKQAAPSCTRLDTLLDDVETFFLNEVLPEPFVKGRQPSYLDDNVDEGAFVVNTGAVRPLAITFGLCRRISMEDYETLTESRKLKTGDLLLTTDGGTSIGKAAVFSAPPVANGSEVDCGFTVDSHVAILRPRGITSTLLSYLLCSPMGQLQFQRAESGASGQTAVSEEDIRRFRFPRVASSEFDSACEKFQSSLETVRRLEAEAYKTRQDGWDAFQDSLLRTDQAGERVTARARPNETRQRHALSN